MASRHAREPQRPVVHYLAGPPDHSRRHGVAVTHLEGTDADLGREAVDRPLHRELRLVGTEPAERAANRVVCPHRDGLNVDHREAVGPSVPGGAFEDLHARPSA